MQSCSLPAPDLDVWWVNMPELDVDEWIMTWNSSLGEQDFERLRQKRLPKGLPQFLFTRLTLRHLLSMYEPAIRPREWRFLRGENGRPYVDPQQSSLSFNLTHSEDKLLLVFSRQGDPGIDVESLQREVDMQPLADRYFFPSEAQQLRELDEAARREWFFRLWTLKEAAVKATGAGLSKALHKFEFGKTAAGDIWQRTHDADPVFAKMAFWSGMGPGFCTGLVCTGMDAGTDIKPLARELVWPDQVGPFEISWISAQSTNSSTNLEP